MTQPIDIGTAAVLGAVQGATEFLPVSSSGHVAVSALLFGETEMPLSVVVVLHIGTLIATIAVFWRDIVDLTRSTVSGIAKPREWIATDEGRLAAGVILGSVPTAAIGLAFKDQVEAFSHVAWIVGVGFLISAAAVMSTRRGGGEADTPSLGQAFWIGLAQGVAVMPGITRSGSTIAVAMLLGMSGPAAFRFSFLLSLPAVTGAALLEFRHPEALAALGPGAWVGGTVALLVGLAALKWLRAMVHRGRFWVFAVYLVPLGFGMVTYGIWA